MASLWVEGIKPMLQVLRTLGNVTPIPGAAAIITVVIDLIQEEEWERRLEDMERRLEMLQSAKDGQAGSEDKVDVGLEREIQRLIRAIQVRKDLTSQINEGRVTTYASYAVVTSMLAAVEASLLTGNAPFSPSKNGIRGNIGVQNFYVFVTYGALIFSLGTTIASIFVIEGLAVRRREAEKDRLDIVREQNVGISRMLLQYLSDPTKRAILALKICFNISFTLCMMFVVTQLLAHIWVYESTLLAALLTPLVATMTVPYVLSIIL